LTRALNNFIATIDPLRSMLPFLPFRKTY